MILASSASEIFPVPNVSTAECLEFRSSRPNDSLVAIGAWWLALSWGPLMPQASKTAIEGVGQQRGNFFEKNQIVPIEGSSVIRGKQRKGA